MPIPRRTSLSRQRILPAFLLIPFWLGALAGLDLEGYRARLASGDPRLGEDLKRAQYRITNRETAYVVARHRVVLDGDPQGAEGLLPDAGRSPWEENLLGFAKQMGGSTEAALFHFQGAFLRSQGRIAAPFLNRSLLLLESGAYVEARRWILENEKHFPGDPDFALVKAVALFALEDFPGADRWLTRTSLFGTQATPDRAAYFRMRGLFLEGRGSNALALVSWRQAAALDPADPLARAKVLLLDPSQASQSGWIDEAALGLTRRNRGEPSGAGPETFLTDRQIRDRLNAIAKLLTNRQGIIDPGPDPLRNAWDRLKELSGENSALYGRDLWYWRAVIAKESERMELAAQCLERAKGSPRSSRSMDERITLLDGPLQAALLAKRRQRAEREQLRLDLEPRRKAIEILLALYPPARRVPIPEAFSNAFDLDLGPAPARAKAEVPATDALPFPTRRRHLRGGETLETETYAWDDQARPLRISLWDGGGALLGSRVFEYSDADRCFRLDASGRTNGMTELRRGKTNDEAWAESREWQEGRLVEVTTTRGSTQTVELPEVTLLWETRTRVEGRVRLDTVRAGGVLLWEDTTLFEGEAQTEGTELRRDRRGPDGQRVETRLWERRGGQPWKETRLSPDGGVLEWWQWEW
ncbi:MAG: hypothetical protein J0L75_20685 [Spirochaetes bacterium]|nr:hypothetical protein [Spirochaetota bacterium]